MKKYTKNINGINAIRTRKQIVLNKNKMNIFNPTEEMILDEGWVEYTSPQEDEIIVEKNNKLLEINGVYNDSKGFYINDIYCTFDTETLNKMLFRVISESSMNINKTTLWFNGNAYPMKTKDALELLYQLQIYYGNCFDISEYHKQNLNKLESVEEIKNYSCNENYPEKLNIKI